MSPENVRIENAVDLLFLSLQAGWTIRIERYLSVGRPYIVTGRVTSLRYLKDDKYLVQLDTTEVPFTFDAQFASHNVTLVGE